MYDRILLASYPQYNDAQAAVDRLSDQHFPVEETSIIGRDLKLVENVTGRLSYGRAALGGAASGAWIGLLFGLFLAIFATDATSTLALILWGLLFGALAGVMISVVAYALTGGRRDFVSTSQLVAERYDVVVDSRTIDDARRILGMSTRGPASGPGRSAPTTPPVAGEPDEPGEPGPADGSGRAERTWAPPTERPTDTDGRRPSLRERLAERAGLRADH